MLRRFLPAAGFLLLAVATGCSESEAGAETGTTKEAALSAKPVTATRVSRMEFERIVHATGSLEPRDEASMRALVAGPIDRVYVDIGDRVRKGRVLFLTRPVESELALQSAEASLNTAKAGLNDLLAWQRSEEVEVLKAELGRARAEFERLDKDRERALSIYEKGAISESQLRAAETAAKSAGAVVEVAEERLRMAESGPTAEAIEVARSRVAEAEALVARACQTVDDTAVEAPFDGVVTSRRLKSGDFANRGDEVVKVTGLTYLEAETRVPERFAQQVTEGLGVRVLVESLGIERPGTVVAVNEAIDPSTRSFLVKVAVENADLSLKAGVFSVCEFDIPPIKDGLAIPALAVQSVEGRRFVWTEKDGRAHRVAVELGESTDGFVQVLTGLTGGETVLVEGIGALVEGDEVLTVGS